MTGKSHLTIGLAAALTIMAPDNIPDALPVITGAAAGCLICDIDCETERERKDSSRWRIAAWVIAAAALIEDHLMGAGMWKSISERSPYLWCAGLAGFAIICTFASISKHRGFSHSLLAMLLEGTAMWLIFPDAAPAFVIAFLSHILLDVLNKKPVRILYPAGKGFCLRLFYADRLADKICTVIGLAWLVLFFLMKGRY